ncbi:MAG TPA: hypothetical protein VG097_00355 [Gemmata sp.]|nr:hypothetical protein [Gemmata sp.]
MHRFAAAWNEFWNSLTWIGKTAEWWEKLGKVIWPFLFILGLALFGAQEIPKLQEVLKERSVELTPYARWLCVIGVVYLLWKAAIAWHKSEGPIIWVGNIEKDDGIPPLPRVFEFKIMNRGTGQVVARVHATDARDGNGKKLLQIDGEFKLHCRGKGADEQIVLYGDKHEIIAPFQVGNKENQTELFLIGAGMRDPSGVFYQLSPIALVDKMIFSIRVDFHDGKSGLPFLKSKSYRIVVVPDKVDPMLYQVRFATWRE